MRPKGRRAFVLPNRPLHCTRQNSFGKEAKTHLETAKRLSPKWYQMQGSLVHLAGRREWVHVVLHTRGVYLCSSDDGVLNEVTKRCTE